LVLKYLFNFNIIIGTQDFMKVPYLTSSLHPYTEGGEGT